VMAELLGTGSTSTPIEPFSITRFAPPVEQRSQAS
jgi:sarcosine oxidase subunit beta